MLRRCTATLALTTLASLILAAEPSPVSAAGIVTEKMVNGVDQIVPYGTAGATNYAYYTLSNPTSSTINDLILSAITPPNSVVPINQTLGPLTIVDNATAYDPKNLEVLLNPVYSPTSQQIALVFNNGGLAGGNVLNFKLSLDPNYTSMNDPVLTLIPPDTTASAPDDLLTFGSYSPNFANAAPGEQPPAVMNTPEPVSLALWSALAAAGLLRARAFRKARRSAASA